MPKWSRTAIAGLLVVCALAGALWVAKLSPSYQDCDASRKQDPTYQKSANSQQERARRFIVCEGAFFDANKEAITAIATIAIAFFTFILWGATRKQAETNDRLADLADRQFNVTHRPHIIIRSFESSKKVDGRIGAFIAFVNAGTAAGTVTGIATNTKSR